MLERLSDRRWETEEVGAVLQRAEEPLDDGSYESDEAPRDVQAEWRPLLGGATTDRLAPGAAQIIEDDGGLSEFIRAVFDRPTYGFPPVGPDARARHIVEFAKVRFDQEAIIGVVGQPVTWCTANRVGVKEVARVGDASVRLKVAIEVYPERDCDLDSFADRPKLGRYAVALIVVKRPVVAIDEVRLVTRIWEGRRGFREIEGELSADEHVE